MISTHWQGIVTEFHCGPSLKPRSGCVKYQCHDFLSLLLNITLGQHIAEVTAATTAAFSSNVIDPKASMTAFIFSVVNTFLSKLLKETQPWQI